jgi:hypothetical protein
MNAWERRASLFFRSAIHVVFGAAGWRIVAGWALLSAAAWLGQAGGAPAITSIKADRSAVTVTVAVPAGVKQVTLESRSRFGSGAWVPCGVKRVSAAGPVTFQLALTAQVELLRVRGDLVELVPASFYGGKTNFAGEVSTTNPTNGTASTSPGAFNGGGTPTTDGGSGRTVVESDIWVIRGDTLYFFNQYRGLQVIDLSVVDAPVVRGTLDLPAAGEQMYLLDDQHAVLLARTDCRGGSGSASRVFIVEVSPVPRVIATLPIDGYLQESRLVGTALYVASQTYRRVPDGGGTGDQWEWGSVVASFDLSQPASPTARNSFWFAGYGNVIAATDEYLFAVVHDPLLWRRSVVQILDISAPDGTMYALGSVRTAGNVPSKFALNLSGNVLTAISDDWDWSNGRQRRCVLENFSLADPRAPALLGELDIVYGETLDAARFDGLRVYVTTSLRIDPLWIIDLTDAAHPRAAGSVEVPGFSTYLQPLGDRLVTMGVSVSNNWRVAVSLFDVRDASRPIPLAQLPLGDNSSWSEANYDEKAFTVLPEAGLLLVPYQGWSSNGYASAVQLVDLGSSTLTARGLIRHSIQARRATLHRDRIVSVSGRELLTVNATDRDQPLVASATDLSWPVNRVLVAGDFLIEIADALAWQGAPNPILRLVKANAPEVMLGRLELTNGLPVIGATVRDGRLYLAQGVTASWLWCLPAGDGPDPDPDPDPATAKTNLFLTVFDLAGLPELRALGQTQTAVAELGWNFSLKPLWLSSSLLVWSGSGSWWGPWIALAGSGGAVITGGVDGPGFVADFWWPWWNSASGRLFACDVGDAAAPRFLAEVNLSTDTSWWSYSDAFATGKLVYSSHQTAQYEEGPAFPKGAWITHYFLDVVDFTDPASPTLRKPVIIPGRLEGISRQGTLLYTVAPHWTATGTTDGIQYLDAAAYDGVAAALVDSLGLTTYSSPPVLVQGESVLVPWVDSTGRVHSLETWGLSNAGRFLKQGTVSLPETPYVLATFGNLLALQWGATITLFDATDPAGLRRVGEATPPGCVWGSLSTADGSLTDGLWLPLGDYGVFGIPVVHGP